MEHKPPFDTSVPNSARIWNYWLGGKDNFAVDRAVGAQVEDMFPQIVQVARAQRAFLRRAVRYLAGETGIRQFLDVGTGLPAADNTHQVAQSIAPESTVVYVDNDPVVLTHAQALLTGTSGQCAYLDADLRDPGVIIAGAGRTLDLAQPVALILLGILGHIADDAEARAIVGHLTAPLAAGSYLVIADGVDTDPAGNQAQEIYNQQSPARYHPRSPARLAAFFDGLDLVEPGPGALCGVAAGYPATCRRRGRARRRSPEAVMRQPVTGEPVTGEPVTGEPVTGRLLVTRGSAALAR